MGGGGVILPPKKKISRNVHPSFFVVTKKPGALMFIGLGGCTTVRNISPLFLRELVEFLLWFACVNLVGSTLYTIKCTDWIP